MEDLVSLPDSHNSTYLDPKDLKGLRKKRILLHCCCAPCASYVIKHLKTTYDITLFFYNPNIEPFEEYIKRKMDIEKLAAMQSLHNDGEVKILTSEYDNHLFSDIVRPYVDEPEGGLRCRFCYEMRLRETAVKAKEFGFDIFGTTLSVSPHKDAKIINDCGERLAHEYNILYLSADFKKNNGYMQSVELSKKFGLYRQNYCGCYYSIKKS